MLLQPATVDETEPWRSEVTGQNLAAAIYVPGASTTAPKARRVQVRLANLATPALGMIPDSALASDAVKNGEVVVWLNYAGHPAATPANLARDILAIREAIVKGTFPPLARVEVDVDSLYIVRSDSVLVRDIVFARDGDRVLAMDVIMPAVQPKSRGAVVEFSCDNVRRMGAGSLLFCRDTLVETMALSGFVAAMADHPVRPPYKGLDDPMPEALERAKAAVATLRADDRLPISGRVGAMGFSRGGPFAAMLAADGTVDAALVHGNRYDYLMLAADDPMLSRFVKAWGPLETNRNAWAIHGAAHYLTSRASPMFLNTSAKESSEYRAGLARWHEVLTTAGVEHEYMVDADERGHRVTTDPAMLARFADFFHQHLDR